MNKKLIYKILLFTILLLGISKKVNAASAIISANNSTLEIGKSATITVNIQDTAAYNLKLTTNGGTLSGQTNDADTSGVNTTKTAMTANFVAEKAGTYTVTLTGQVVSESCESKNVSQSVTISAKSTATVAPTVKPTQDSVTFKSVNETVYAKANANIRTEYNTSAEILGTLKAGSSIVRKGIGSNGWDKVEYKGHTAYVSHSLLTLTAPVVETETPTPTTIPTEEPTATPTVVVTSTPTAVTSEEQQETVYEIAELTPSTLPTENESPTPSPTATTSVKDEIEKVEENKVKTGIVGKIINKFSNGLSLKTVIISCSILIIFLIILLVALIKLLKKEDNDENEEEKPKEKSEVQTFIEDYDKEYERRASKKGGKHF